MKGKYRNLGVHAIAVLVREQLRSKVAKLIDWEPLIAAESGCTVIIGVCSKLPDVLLANLRCLSAARWPDLKRVILVVDCLKGAFPASIERDVMTTFPELKVEFIYYSVEQFSFAESRKLPYVYSWLSWCIGLKHTSSSHILLHDYDALVFGPALRRRYEKFIASGAKVQGVTWYATNGLEIEDHLATTFEAFIDTAWLRSLKPVALFNKVRIVGGRSVDLDTTLDIQQRQLSGMERAIVPMSHDELVHPSQMIHQYTMFRRSPNAVLPCFAIPQIPFFRYLSGHKEAIDHATRELAPMKRDNLDFVGDGTRINLSMLGVGQVDWALKQMVQACLALSIAPDPRIYLYGRALYQIIQAPVQDIWRGDFTDKQRSWIDAAAKALSLESIRA